MEKSIYNSHTHGPIPLSFTGRRLMQNLRDAITGAVRRGDYNDPRMEVAHARGEIAQYMSKLETRDDVPCALRLKEIAPGSIVSFAGFKDRYLVGVYMRRNSYESTPTPIKFLVSMETGESNYKPCEDAGFVVHSD